MQLFNAPTCALAILHLLSHVAFLGFGDTVLLADLGPRRGVPRAPTPGGRKRFVHLFLHPRENLLETRVLSHCLQRLGETFAAGTVGVGSEAAIQNGGYIALLAEHRRRDERLGEAALTTAAAGSFEAPAQDAPQLTVHFAPLAFLSEFAAVAGEIEISVAAAAEALAHPPDALRSLFEGEGTSGGASACQSRQGSAAADVDCNSNAARIAVTKLDLPSSLGPCRTLSPGSKSMAAAAMPAQSVTWRRLIHMVFSRPSTRLSGQTVEVV